MAPRQLSFLAEREGTQPEPGEQDLPQYTDEEIAQMRKATMEALKLMESGEEPLCHTVRTAPKY